MTVRRIGSFRTCGRDLPIKGVVPAAKANSSRPNHHKPLPTVSSSQFSSQLPSFLPVRRGVRAGYCAHCRRREPLRTAAEATWKAGWVQALAGSNPASSAIPKQALTCGNAVRIRSARDGVASNIEAASLNSGLSFRPPTARNPAFRGPGVFAAVR